MTLNPKNRRFGDFLTIFLLQKSELRRNGWIQTKITCKQELLQALVHLMNISSDFLFCLLSCHH